MTTEREDQKLKQIKQGIPMTFSVVLAFNID